MKLGQSTAAQIKVKMTIRVAEQLPSDATSVRLEWKKSKDTGQTQVVSAKSGTATFNEVVEFDTKMHFEKKNVLASKLLLFALKQKAPKSTTLGKASLNLSDYVKLDRPIWTSVVDLKLGDKGKSAPVVKINIEVTITKLKGEGKKKLVHQGGEWKETEDSESEWDQSEADPGNLSFSDSLSDTDGGSTKKKSKANRLSRRLSQSFGLSKKDEEETPKLSRRTSSSKLTSGEDSEADKKQSKLKRLSLKLTGSSSDKHSKSDESPRSPTGGLQNHTPKKQAVSQPPALSQDSGAERQYKCNVPNCGKSFRSQKGLTTHQADHSEKELAQAKAISSVVKNQEQPPDAIKKARRRSSSVNAISTSEPTKEHSKEHSSLKSSAEEKPKEKTGESGKHEHKRSSSKSDLRASDAKSPRSRPRSQSVSSSPSSKSSSKEKEKDPEPTPVGCPDITPLSLRETEELKTALNNFDTAHANALAKVFEPPKNEKKEDKTERSGESSKRQKTSLPSKQAEPEVEKLLKQSRNSVDVPAAKSSKLEPTKESTKPTPKKEPVTTPTKEQSKSKGPADVTETKAASNKRPVKPKSSSSEESGGSEPSGSEEEGGSSGSGSGSGEEDSGEDGSHSGEDSGSGSETESKKDDGACTCRIQ